MSSLGNDLAHLRKEQDLTLEDVRDETKIPIRILQSIENDKIFTDFDENRTYIRSFVRSYGKALRIDDRLLRIALDQTEVDQYQDLLQKVDPYNPGVITDEPPFSIPGQKKGKKRWRAGKKDKNGGKTSFQAAHDKRKQDPNNIRDLSDRTTPSENSINWAAVGQRFRSMDNSSRAWILMLSVLFFLFVVGYFFFYDSEMNSQTPPSTDSLAQIEQDISSNNALQLDLNNDEETDTNGTNASSSTVLSDTLELVVYAANGKLEPVRIKSDLFDQTLPYWLEQGEAMRFNFVDTIRVRGQLSRMVLLMNNQPITDFTSRFYQQDSDEVQIPRSFFENDPKWNSNPPSLSELNIPVPDTIRDRPTFNQNE